RVSSASRSTFGATLAPRGPGFSSAPAAAPAAPGGGVGSAAASAGSSSGRLRSGSMSTVSIPLPCRRSMSRAVARNEVRQNGCLSQAPLTRCTYMPGRSWWTGMVRCIVDRRLWGAGCRGPYRPDVAWLEHRGGSPAGGLADTIPQYQRRPAMPHSPEEKRRVLARVRRIRGQAEALERALEAGADCAPVLQQIAAIRGAVNGLMSEVMEAHIRETFGHAAGSDEQRQARV